MSERETAIREIIIGQGLAPLQVGIGQNDDLPWAQFRVGQELVTVVATQDDSDSIAAADIVRQARDIGL